MATPKATTTRRTGPRLLAALAAVAAALAVWALAALALGIEVSAPAMGEEPVQTVGAVNVAVTTALAALAGWGLLALLERFTARAHHIWGVAAVLVALVSLGAPMTGEGIDGASRAVLAALHVVVAAVLVPPLYRTSRDRLAA